MLNMKTIECADQDSNISIQFKIGAKICSEFVVRISGTESVADRHAAI